MAIAISVNQADRLPVDDALIKAAVHAALASQRVTDGDLAVTFLDDPEIREMNREYLDHDWSTDVISFDLSSDPQAPPESVSGEVYIGVDRARAQALEREIPPHEEAVRLTVHGILHVLGHEHPDEKREESEFFRLQERLVKRVIGSRGDGAPEAAR